MAKRTKKGAVPGASIGKTGAKTRPPAAGKAPAPEKGRSGDAGAAKPGLTGGAARIVTLLRRPHVLPVALLLLLHVVLYRDVVFGGDLLLGSGTDILSAQIPYRTAAAARLAAGELPLWSPAHFAGAPLLAGGQSGATYPPYWLLVPFSPARAVSLTLVLHLFLAGLFTYFLAHRLRRVSRSPDDPDSPTPTPETGPQAAAGPLLAAVLVSLGGGLQGHTFAGHVNLVEAFAWVPALLLALDILVERPGPLAAAGLALPAGLLLLAGHPQVAFLAALAALAWSAVLLLRRPWRARIVAAAWLAVAGVFALLLAALLLLPMLELAGDSHRQLAADPWRLATQFAAAPVTLLQTVLAHPFGVPAGDGPGWWADFGRWEPQGWVGIAAALLAAVAVAARPDRRRVTLLALAVLSLLLALGDATPLYRAFAAMVPGATLFRVPARFLLLAGLALPLLASLGLDALVRGARPKRLRIAVVATVVGLALPLLALQASFASSGPESQAAEWAAAHGSGGVVRLLEQGGPDAARARALVQEPLRAAAGDGLLWLLTVGGLAAALAFLPRRRAAAPLSVPLPYWLGGAVALVVVGQAITFAAPWIVTAEGDPRPALGEGLLAAIRSTAGHDRIAFWEDRRWNAGMEVDAAGDAGGGDAGIRNIGGYDPAITWRVNDILNLRIGLEAGAGRRGGWQPPSPPPSSLWAPLVEAATDGRFRHRLWMLWPTGRSARPTRAWDLLAARAIVTRDLRRAGRLPGLVSVATPAQTGTPYAVFENPRAFPRAGLSYGAIVEPLVLQRLFALARPQYEPRRALVFEEAPEPLLEPPPPAPSDAPLSGGSLAWEADEPERVVLTVETDRPAYLWLADTWRPGWTATVDGAEAPLLRANHAFRAVAVPEGAHRVEMLYRPGSVRLGAGLSLLGIALVGLLAWRGRRRRADL